MTLHSYDVALIAITIALTLANIARVFVRRRFMFASYLGVTWAMFISFTAADLFSFAVGTWILALLSFVALREYFSLVEVRIQDRLAILGAYLSIPFMFYFVAIDWYGMFIVSIPVYSFLAIPLLITLGGKQREGTILSIGAIEFGLFLLYCMGHLGYLMRFSPWMAAALVIQVAVCDLAACLLRDRSRSLLAETTARFLVPLPLTIAVALLLSPWTGIPTRHSLILGGMIPLLAIMGHRTADYVQVDLLGGEGALFPDRGRVLDDLKSFLFATPVVFHYIRYFLK
jgi:phosphatidate cytidylyltransferase